MEESLYDELQEEAGEARRSVRNLNDQLSNYDRRLDFYPYDIDELRRDRPEFYEALLRNQNRFRIVSRVRDKYDTKETEISNVLDDLGQLERQRIPIFIQNPDGSIQMGKLPPGNTREEENIAIQSYISRNALNRSSDRLPIGAIMRRINN